MLQRTHAGIHRDDIDIRLKGHQFKNIASQGQRKSLLFAMKLAEYEMLKTTKGIRTHDTAWMMCLKNWMRFACISYSKGSANPVMDNFLLRTPMKTVSGNIWKICQLIILLSDY